MKAHDFLTNLVEKGIIRPTGEPHQFDTLTDRDSTEFAYIVYQAVMDKTVAHTITESDTSLFTFDDGSYIELEDDTIIASTPEYRILSIDAWRGPEGGWWWNDWFDVGRVPAESAQWPPRKLLKWFRTEGYLNSSSAGKLTVEDDGYNIVIMHKNTRKPLFAVEYGANQ